jgi:hypothetical protein
MTWWIPVALSSLLDAGVEATAPSTEPVDDTGLEATALATGEDETLTLLIGDAWMGGLVDVTVLGAPAGADVGLAYATSPPSEDATCVRAARSCLDLVAPTLVARTTADEGGVATFRVSLPIADPFRHHVQVTLLRPAPGGESPVVTVDPGAYRTDTDGDRAFDAVEAMLGLDRFDPDTDGDALLDGRDLFPTDPTRGAGDGFRRDDVVVSDPDGWLMDPEWEVDSGRLVWQTRDGAELWLAETDLTTGALIPPDGKGTLLARDVAPLDLAENGPEWSESAGRSEVLFAQRDAGGTWRLAHAWQDAGTWRTGLLPGPTAGFGPLAQHDRTEQVPRIDWWRRGDDGRVQHGFGTLDAPELGLMPRGLIRADDRYASGLGPVISGTARHRGAATNAAYQQVFLHDTERGTTTWVTDDATWKYDATVWVDPRTGDPVAVVSRGDAFVDRYVEVAVYRRVDGVWSLQKVIRPPPATPYVIMPRPLIWKGRSYVHFTASQGWEAHQTQVGQIWLASIDPDDPLLRRIDQGNGAVKMDSEAVTVGARPWVYYSQGAGARRLLRRCELGLP